MNDSSAPAALVGVPERPSWAPETVTEAVVFLAAEGYVDDYRSCTDDVVAPETDETHPMLTAVVDYTFRFEGASDPGDQAIVLGVSCPRGGRKGVVVSAYGADADTEEAALLVALAKPAQ